MDKNVTIRPKINLMGTTRDTRFLNLNKNNLSMPSPNASNMHIVPTDQSPSLPSTSQAYPVGLFSHHDQESPIIRRTRSLIPQSVKCQIIQIARENPRITQGDIAQMFGIDRTTVSKILKRRSKYMDSSTNHFECSRPKIIKTNTLDVTKDLIVGITEKWIVQARQKGEVVTQPIVKNVLYSVAKEHGLHNLKFDEEWFTDFFQKHNIREPDIEDWIKQEPKEYPTSTDDDIYFQSLTFDLKESSNKSSKVGRITPSAKPANRTKDVPAVPTSTSNQSAVTISDNNISVPRQNVGNKIPRVQTETADTTREDLTDLTKEVEELGTNEAFKREMGNLEKFREQQKLIEEANKQRKALLSKTLSERQKKADEEAKKLAHIQREVMILDNLLTADVNVIRSRIEVASREFLDAQKRYEKAEREFVESKLDLQKKSELKEHLTEHLYTIIHQNEIRKATKLSELMKELEMEQASDTPVLQQLPPLSSFNTMSSADTLHLPKSPPATVSANNGSGNGLKQVTNETTTQSLTSGATEDVSKNNITQVTNESNAQDKNTLENNPGHKANTNSGQQQEQKSHTDPSSLCTNANKQENIIVNLTVCDSSQNSESHINSAVDEKSSEYNVKSPVTNDNSPQNVTENVPSTWTLDVVKKT